MKNLFLFILIALVYSCDKPETELPQKEIIITFDDAPAFPENTTKILDVLQKYHVQATFFCIGKYLKMFPTLATRIAKEQIMANHTYTHLPISAYNLNDILEPEIYKTQRLIDSINLANHKPLNNYFRAPSSAITEEQMNALSDLGFKITWWDISAEEWDSEVSVYEIINCIYSDLNKTETPIILFHLADHTVRALDLILNDLQKTNIKVVSLDERK